MRSRDRDELLIRMNERQTAMHEDIKAHTAKLDALIPTVAKQGAWIRTFKWGGGLIFGTLATLAWKIIGK